MANPKQKRSKSNTRARRATWKSRLITVSTCPRCHKDRRPHFACENCGYYNGHLVIAQKDEVASPKAKG